MRNDYSRKKLKVFIVYKEERNMTEVKTITTEEVQERLENGETLSVI